MSIIQNIIYIIAALLFVIGIKKLSSPATAKRGNMLSALGMLLGICVTLLDQQIVTFNGILIGMGIGTVVGIAAARMIAMTAMPEMVALLNGFGGISSLLVGWAAYVLNPSVTPLTAAIICISVVIGGMTFSGSIIAWAKLSESISGKPVFFWGQKLFNSGLLVGAIILSVLFSLDPVNGNLFFMCILVGSLLLGILAVISIGGGDMPVVISLLNSYSGVAACAAGFVIENILLIVAGALVGASGLILTNIMCKSMNRSLSNVLFSGFGSEAESGEVGESQGEINPISVEDAYLILEAASSVVIVPGYGMAVAQAQHVVQELGEILEERGMEVNFSIHPVAGRMPGHMNVLLAEANVPYEQLQEMDDTNSMIDMVDVCIVIGANDVVNPDALDKESSPIYGMPIIETHRAKTVFVLKRSMNPGFAGVQNPLFFKENTRMLFGDAKASIQGMVAEFKE